MFFGTQCIDARTFYNPNVTIRYVRIFAIANPSVRLSVCRLSEYSQHCGVLCRFVVRHRLTHSSLPTTTRWRSHTPILVGNCSTHFPLTNWKAACRSDIWTPSVATSRCMAERWSFVTSTSVESNAADVNVDIQGGTKRKPLRSINKSYQNLSTKLLFR